MKTRSRMALSRLTLAIIVILVIVVAAGAAGVESILSGNGRQGCVGIAAVAPQLSISNYKGYDIWTQPFSGIACRGTDTSAKYQIVRASESPVANPNAVVKGSFASVRSAEAYIDSLPS